MAINKEKKQSLVKQYVQDLQEAKNLVLVKQSGLPVSTDAKIRKGIREEDGKYNVIRKRLFLRALKDAGYPDLDPNQLDGSAIAVYSRGDEYAPLKVINKYLKDFKKAKDSNASFEFLGGYFNKEWRDGIYVNELANIPSKEELLSKLVWIFNYPVQSLTSVLDQISKKKVEGGDSTPAIKEETKEETKVEEVVTSEEIKVEEPVETKEEIIESTVEETVPKQTE